MTGGFCPAGCVFVWTGEGLGANKLLAEGLAREAIEGRQILWKLRPKGHQSFDIVEKDFAISYKVLVLATYNNYGARKDTFKKVGC